MAFLETPRFPREVAAGAIVRIIHSVESVTTASGYEVSNANWSQGLRVYDISMPLPSDPLADALQAHYLVTKGKTHGFRLECPRDFRCIQADGYLGQSATGTASLTYQLHKLYVTGALSEFRQIRKPEVGTVTVYRAGVPATVGTGANQYTLDTTTGIVTWGAGSTVNGILLAWLGDFDTPVKYATELGLQHRRPGVYISEQISLREIRV